MIKSLADLDIGCFLIPNRNIGTGQKPISNIFASKECLFETKKIKTIYWRIFENQKNGFGTHMDHSMPNWAKKSLVLAIYLQRLT